MPLDKRERLIYTRRMLRDYLDVAIYFIHKNIEVDGLDMLNHSLGYHDLRDSIMWCEFIHGGVRIGISTTHRDIMLPIPEQEFFLEIRKVIDAHFMRDKTSS